MTATPVPDADVVIDSVDPAAAPVLRPGRLDGRLSTGT
jgi:hypothetical protein